MARQLSIPFSNTNPATVKGYGDCNPPECADGGEGPVCVECGDTMEVDGPEATCNGCGHTDGPDYEAMAGC